MKLRINKQVLWFGAYSLILLGIFLYVRFPRDVLTNYFMGVISGCYPGLRLCIESTKPELPLGIGMKNVTLGFPYNPDASLYLNTLSLRPKIQGILKGAHPLTLNANAYNGKMEGYFNLPSYTVLKGKADGEIKVRDLVLADCLYLKDILGRQITGKLTGKFTLRGKYDNIDDGAIDFAISKGQYHLQRSLLGFERIDFLKIEGRITIKNGVMKLTGVKLTGDRVKCSLKGDIALKGADIKNSTVDMKCDMQIQGQNNKKSSIAITGTVGNPLARIL
jgi:type II secretion system protein N